MAEFGDMFANVGQLNCLCHDRPRQRRRHRNNWCPCLVRSGKNLSNLSLVRIPGTNSARPAPTSGRHRARLRQSWPGMAPWTSEPETASLLGNGRVMEFPVEACAHPTARNTPRCGCVPPPLMNRTTPRIGDYGRGGGKLDWHSRVCVACLRPALFRDSELRRDAQRLLGRTRAQTPAKVLQVVLASGQIAPLHSYNFCDCWSASTTQSGQHRGHIEQDMSTSACWSNSSSFQ